MRSGQERLPKGGRGRQVSRRAIPRGVFSVQRSSTTLVSGEVCRRRGGALVRQGTGEKLRVREPANRVSLLLRAKAKPIPCRCVNSCPGVTFENEHKMRQRALLMLVALPGLLALVALAAVLALSAGGPERTSPGVEDSSPLTSPGEVQRTEPGSCPDGAVPPPACRSSSLPSGEALRHEPSTHRGVELRQPNFGKFLVPEAGLPNSQLPAWLPHLGVARPVFPQASLQVLFCTWLA
jgi:hypothetical protein